MFWDSPLWEAAIWPLLGAITPLLFFSAVMLAALMLRQRRYRALGFVVPVLLSSYFLLQCAANYFDGEATAPVAQAVARYFASYRGLLLLLLCLGLGLCEWLLLRGYMRYEAGQITPFSIKEAADTLPAGLCFYREDGRVLLVNPVMERLGRRLTGTALVNGREFYDRLCAGELPPGCQRTVEGETPLIVLEDGAAWSFSRSPAGDAEFRANLLLAADVTEIYEKTRALRSAQEKVLDLNRRLTAYNREIVALTAQREILNAKVRIHDELGSNLIAIRRFLSGGGSEADRAELAGRLRLNVSFLKSGYAPAAQDEYALMLETAEVLGVSVRVEGEMPGWEPARHVLAVAIHECFTNTLRHARGQTLWVRIADAGDAVVAEFTNDGEQPRGPIRERGGLRSLRTLVERTGGQMRIRTTPAFSIALTLPKEDAYGLSSDDRGRPDGAPPAV